MAVPAYDSDAFLGPYSTLRRRGEKKGNEAAEGHEGLSTLQYLRQLRGQAGAGNAPRPEPAPVQTSSNVVCASCHSYNDGIGLRAPAAAFTGGETSDEDDDDLAMLRLKMDEVLSNMQNAVGTLSIPYGEKSGRRDTPQPRRSERTAGRESPRGSHREVRRESETEERAGRSSRSVDSHSQYIAACDKSCQELTALENSLNEVDCGLEASAHLYSLLSTALEEGSPSKLRANTSGAGRRVEVEGGVELFEMISGDNRKPLPSPSPLASVPCMTVDVCASVFLCCVGLLLRRPARSEEEEEDLSTNLVSVAAEEEDNGGGMNRLEDGVYTRHPRSVHPDIYIYMIYIPGRSNGDI
jgi:hypothetical protein